MRAESLLMRGFMDNVATERTIFLHALDSMVEELISTAQLGKTSFYAEYFRCNGQPIFAMVSSKIQRGRETQ